MMRKARIPWASVRLAVAFLLLVSCADLDPRPVIIPLKQDPELSVRLTVGGQTAWFMFDTGAGAHTLARWFVDAAGLTIDDSLRIRGRDVGGNPVAFSVVRNLEGRLTDGTTLVLGSAIVTDFPPEFQQEEMGGLLNPQLLSGDQQAVVLDLRVPELRIEPFEDAVRRVDAQPMDDDQVQSCSEPDAPVPNLLYAVLAKSRDENAWLQLDTGSGETTIVADNAIVAGLPLEEGGETMGVAGKPQSYSVAHDLVVSFAGQRATVDAQVVEAYRGCGSDGLLGRDALGHCALVFSMDSLAITCQSDHLQTAS